MKPAIVVTAMAWRTPLGPDLSGTISKLREGARAATRDHRLFSETYASPWGAPLAAEPAASPHRRFLKRIGLSALECATEAFAPLAARGLDPDRIGLFFGYGGLRADWHEMKPALMRQREDGRGSWAHGLAELHPFWILKHLSNNAHALAAETLRIRGEGVTFGGLNAGSQALGAAIQALRAGAVDQALVVSQDSLLEPETIVALGEKNLLAKTELAAPYGADASGFVVGEASAAVVLERAADTRGTAWAAIDALDISDGQALLPSPDTLKMALRRFGRSARLIEGAGIAAPGWDSAERKILADFLGDGAPLTCTLSSMGQLGASSALVQLIALVTALRDRTAAPIAGLACAAPGPLAPLTRALVRADMNAGIAVNAGFPGLLGLTHVEAI